MLVSVKMQMITQIHTGAITNEDSVLTGYILEYPDVGPDQVKSPFDS